MSPFLNLYVCSEPAESSVCACSETSGVTITRIATNALEKLVSMCRDTDNIAEPQVCIQRHWFSERRYHVFRLSRTVLKCLHLAGIMSDLDFNLFSMPCRQLALVVIATSPCDRLANITCDWITVTLLIWARHHIFLLASNVQGRLFHWLVCRHDQRGL
jgi:hypothetical protein